MTLSEFSTFSKKTANSKVQNELIQKRPKCNNHHPFLHLGHRDLAFFWTVHTNIPSSFRVVHPLLLLLVGPTGRAAGALLTSCGRSRPSFLEMATNPKKGGKNDKRPEFKSLRNKEASAAGSSGGGDDQVVEPV